MGGWKIIPGSCNCGFRSRPSAGTGNRRSKGLDVNSTKSRKLSVKRPITARMRATTGSGRLRLKLATAQTQPACISSHSSRLPSWLPQEAAMRYISGRCEFECEATFSNEKSLLMKLSIRQP